jgi:hypothetical protein
VSGKRRSHWRSIFAVIGAGRLFPILADGLGHLLPQRSWRRTDDGRRCLLLFDAADILGLSPCVSSWPWLWQQVWQQPCTAGRAGRACRQSRRFYRS